MTVYGISEKKSLRTLPHLGIKWTMHFESTNFKFTTISIYRVDSVFRRQSIQSDKFGELEHSQRRIGTHAWRIWYFRSRWQRCFWRYRVANSIIRIGCSPRSLYLGRTANVTLRTSRLVSLFLFLSSKAYLYQIYRNKLFLLIGTDPRVLLPTGNASEQQSVSLGQARGWQRGWRRWITTVGVVSGRIYTNQSNGKFPKIRTFVKTNSFHFFFFFLIIFNYRLSSRSSCPVNYTSGLI